MQAKCHGCGKIEDRKEQDGAWFLEYHVDKGFVWRSTHENQMGKILRVDTDYRYFYCRECERIGRLKLRMKEIEDELAH